MTDLSATLVIGTMASKAILKLWLRGKEDAAESVAESLSEMVVKRVTDRIAQRRTTRQFESLAERIAEALVPLFEGEGLSQPGKRAVILAVADVLNRAGQASKAVVEVGLDADKFATFLLSLGQ